MTGIDRPPCRTCGALVDALDLLATGECVDCFRAWEDGEASTQNTDALVADLRALIDRLAAASRLDPPAWATLDELIRATCTAWAVLDERRQSAANRRLLAGGRNNG